MALFHHPDRLSACAAALCLTTAAPAWANDGDAVLPVVQVKATAPRDASSEGTGLYTTRSANTATRLDLTLRETPQSISVITRTQMDDFALRSVNDVLANTTGVTVEKVETDRTYFTSRGFDISNFQIDGLGLPFATGDQLGDIDTAAYDRVEVLRGANGLMSSTGNPSATINFVRKRPTPQWQASAVASLGSWNTRRAEGDIAGPLNESGSVRQRVVVAAQKGDSYLDRYSLEKALFSGSVEVDLAPGTLLSLGHMHQSNKPNSPMWGALTLPGHYERSASTAAEWAYWDTDDLQSFAELKHELGSGWKGRAVLTRRDLSSDGELFYVYQGADPVTGAPALFSFPSKYWHSERQWLLDVYASGPFTLGGRTHELVLGVNGSKSDNALRSVYDQVGVQVSEETVLSGSFPHPAFDTGIGDQADFEDKRRSLYGAARFNLADDLKLIAGANLTRVQSNGLQYGEVHNYSATKTTPFLGAVQDLDAQHSLYASFARIFNPQYKIDANSSILPPIEGNNFEVGIKGEWLDKRLKGSVALFRTEQNNTADLPTFSGGFTHYTPVNATSTGFELDMAGSISTGWELSAGYTQLRLKNDAGADARTHVPRKTLRASTSYRVASVTGLTLGAQMQWQDRIQHQIVPVQQGAYALLGVIAKYELSPTLNLALNLNNLTDERYLTSLQWEQSYYGPPRNGSATLTWTF